MKNRTSIFKKKGFFVALYSSLGAVMVLALVISFNNLNPGGDMRATGEEQGDTAIVTADQVESYLVRAEIARAEEDDEQAWLRPRQRDTVTPSPQPPAQPRTLPAQPPAAPTVPTERPEAEAEPAVDPPQTEQDNAETTAEIEEPATTPEPAPTADASNGIAFTPFSESDRMVWPVAGEIAMVFSLDRLVYDPTLDQYRTNDDLRIAAKEGTPVKAGFDGQVLAIGRSNVYGNYVSIDHGNGYVATYGQLMDGLLVDEGETVKTGQVIGGVGKPSYFGSLNGTHVNLRVTKDESPIDPRDILAEGEN